MWVTGYNERLSVTVATDVRDENEKPVPAVYLKDANAIVLDSSLHGVQRRQAIVHEIGEYLDFKMGIISHADQEGKNNRTALIESQFASDLKAQGGDGIIDAIFGDVNAKEKLENGGHDSVIYLPHYQDSTQEPFKVACGHCHTRHYPPSAVTSSTPAWDPSVGVNVMTRVLVCACEYETLWVQACTSDGTPLDMLVGRARVSDTRKRRLDGGQAG